MQKTATLYCRFSLTCAIFLVMMQVFALWHMAQYGFAAHSHHGETCAVTVYQDHQHPTCAATPAIPPASVAAILLPQTWLVSARIFPARIHLTHPRAPPTLLLA